MEVSDSVQITDKGVDELARRVYKLGVRARGVLIQLTKPKNFGYLVEHSGFPRDVLLETITGLHREGFVTVSRNISPLSVEALQPPQPASPKTVVPGEIPVEFRLDEEIVLSEAKFLLTDFCVDCFGTGSEDYADQVHACDSVRSIELLLKKIRAGVEQKHPGQLSVLAGIVVTINETA